MAATNYLFRSQILKVGRQHKRCLYRLMQNSLSVLNTNRSSSFFRVFRQKSDSTFDALLETRRSEAERSVVVQISSRHAIEGICKEELVKCMHFYTLAPNKEFVLLEMKTDDDLRSFMREVKFSSKSNCIPVQSHFMEFKRDFRRNGDGFEQNNLPVTEETRLLDEKNMLNRLSKAEDIPTQMMLLYDWTKQREVDSRLKFLICAQLESAFSNLFPENHIYPFGSSVNGFGRSGNDLDMVWDIKAHRSRTATDESVVFQPKYNNNDDRTQVQWMLEAIGNILRVLIPGCNDVEKILSARVPIIKFHHAYAGMDCDFSMSNICGLHMAEILYLFCEYDNRVRPLVFTLLKWARLQNITHPNPGPYITNFQMTLFIIFFLQQTSNPVLPTLTMLKNLAGEGDDRGIGGPRRSFVRNVNKIPVGTNDFDLHRLLAEFFAFYANFDFKTKGLSIVSGSIADKFERTPLCIENPLEHELNVSRNVNSREVKKLVHLMRRGLECLDRRSGKSKGDNWGILSLFDSSLVQESVALKARSLFFDQQVGGGRVTNLHPPKQVGGERVANLHPPKQVGGGRVTDLHQPKQVTVGGGSRNVKSANMADKLLVRTNRGNKVGKRYKGNLWTKSW